MSFIQQYFFCVFLPLLRSVSVTNSAISPSDSGELFYNFLEFTPAKMARLPRR